MSGAYEVKTGEKEVDVVAAFPEKDRTDNAGKHPADGDQDAPARELAAEVAREDHADDGHGGGGHGEDERAAVRVPEGCAEEAEEAARRG